MGTLEGLSLELGRSRSLLCVFKKSENLPKELNAKQVQLLYLEKVAKSQAIREELQGIYYELQDLKRHGKGTLTAEFGRYLETKGLIGHRYGIYVVLNSCFKSAEILSGNRYTKRYKTIIQAFKEWKNETLQHTL